MDKASKSVISGRYRIESFLGRGGMAEVYKVWDNQRATYLAMKVLLEDLALDPVFIRRFTREASNLARLQHPNIVRFFGFEKVGRTAFILMDYVDGESLKYFIHDTNGLAMPSGQIRYIMRSVCRALNYAHTQGIIHCDIKPANIMIDRQGTALLADFGIARASDTATATMVGAGTPAYMAPEQIKGYEPTPQMDVYALGVVLYEMLTGGERPFTGNQAQIKGSIGEKVRWEHLNVPPPSPRHWNPALFPSLENVVLEALSKNPRQRYRSTLEFLNALELALGKGESIAPIPKLVPERARLPVQPHQPKARQKSSVGKSSVLALGLIATILVLFAVLVLFALRGNNILASPSGISYEITPLNTPDSTKYPTVVLPTSLPTESNIIAAQTVFATETLVPTEEMTATLTLTLVPSPTLPPQEDGIVENKLDGAELVYIPAGEFWMGSGNGSPTKEQPRHQVYLDAFWIDQTEVMNAQFARFVNETGYQTVAEIAGRSSVYKGSTWVEIANADWRQPNGAGDSINNKSTHPVVHIAWQDASTYCVWSGGRLPTEAEWEKAARGNTQSTYPWGNAAPSSQYSNYNNFVMDTVAVGSYPRGSSAYGVYDMAGNVWEWVADWYDEDYYQYSTQNNPQGPTSGSKRVFRGGSFDDTADHITATVRVGFDPNRTSSSIGFRCVVDVAQ